MLTNINEEDKCETRLTLETIISLMKKLDNSLSDGGSFLCQALSTHFSYLFISFMIHMYKIKIISIEASLTQVTS